MQINPSVARQLVYAAVIGFLLSFLPEIANRLDDGWNADDWQVLNGIVGAALAAAIRAVIALIPVSSSGP